MSALDVIFGYGLPMLVDAGTPEKQARSFLGGLRKAHGDDAVVNKLRECMRTVPLQPLQWLAAALPPKGRGKLMTDTSTQNYQHYDDHSF